ncbi:hypothetical protein Aperf_G00000095199 [Anoplocephala perfoliata]
MEFQASYHKGYNSTQDRLRVLEQIIYGGLGGCLQMAHPVMMDEIISWQDASGCFKAVKDNEEILPDSVHFEPDVSLKDSCLPRLTSMAAAALTMHLYRFSTSKIFTPDFHSILKLESIFALNEKKYPDFIESRPDSSRIGEVPYATVPDTVL